MKRFNRILMILLLIQLGLILFWDRPWSTQYTPTVAAHPFFPGFTEAQAERIEIELAGQRLRLIKDSAWYVETEEGRIRANDFYLDTLLSGLARIKKKNLQSRNPEKAGVFGLDDISAIGVKVFGANGESLAGLMVGKNLGPSRGTYVKESGASEVYLVMEDLRYACVRGDDWISSWRDDTILPLTAEQIRAVHVESANGSWSLERNPDGDWPLEGEGEKMLDILSSLKAEGFAPKGVKPEKMGMNESDLKIVVAYQYEGGEKESVLLFSPDREGYRYLMLNGDASTLYKVPGYPFRIFLRN